MTRSATHPAPWLRIALEMGPIGVFFLAFQFGGDLLAVPVLHDTMSLLTGPAVLSGEGGPLFLATALFMLAIGLSLGTSWSLTRQLPRMAVLTGIVVVVFGGLTLALGSETFIKMKPTVVNALFALILGVGLLRGQSYLKYLLGQTMPLDDAGWMIFTRRWVMFFVFLAALNEVVWRSQSDAVWVSFKTFGNLPLTLAFVAAQWPLLQRHMREAPPDTVRSDDP